MRDLLKSVERDELNSGLTPPALIRGNNDRLNGWLEVHEWLKPFEKESKITTNFQSLSTCTEFNRTFPALIHDEKRPEDVDTDLEDHCGDEFRYGIMSRPKPTITAQQKEDKEFNLMIKRKKLRIEGKRENVFI